MTALRPIGSAALEDLWSLVYGRFKIFYPCRSFKDAFGTLRSMRCHIRLRYAPAVAKSAPKASALQRCWEQLVCPPCFYSGKLRKRQ